MKKKDIVVYKHQSSLKLNKLQYIKEIVNNKDFRIKIYQQINIKNIEYYKTS